ncbi:MAG: SH3 domain-containing protein [Ruminococcus sp.]|nr:SH3 domain-containing protein [Ruminococcus sp.]
MDNQFNNFPGNPPQGDPNLQQYAPPPADPNMQYAQPPYDPNAQYAPPPADQNMQYAQPPYDPNGQFPPQYDPGLQQYAPPPPAPDYRYPSQQDGYDYGYAPYGEPPQKKSYTGLLIGIIIALLVAIIGVLGYLYLTKGNDSGSSEVNAPAAVTTQAVSEEASAEDGTITTNVATESTSATVTTTVTTTPSVQVKQFPESEISRYPQYGEFLEKQLKDESSVTWFLTQNYYQEGFSYSLADLNGDDMPEFITASKEGYIVGIYTISGGKVCELNAVGGGFRDGITIYSDGIIAHSGSGGAMLHGATYYIYEGGTGLTKLYDMLYEYDNSGNVTITKTVNGAATVITEAESKAMADALAPEFTPALTPVGKLGITIETKPKDTYLYRGYVATEKDPLNLREEPSAEGKVIKQLPKGTKGDIYAVEGNSEWYKFVTDAGETGYVAAKYIKEFKGSQASGTSTPYGTFTYTNYSKSHDSNTYNASDVNINVTADFSAYNEKNSRNMIDNVYFRIRKSDSTKPHDYTISFIFTGTMLNGSYLYFNPSCTLTTDSGGNMKKSSSLPHFEATLYEGETFCYDSIYWFEAAVTDNTSYILTVN